MASTTAPVVAWIPALACDMPGTLFAGMMALARYAVFPCAVATKAPSFRTREPKASAIQNPDGSRTRAAAVGLVPERSSAWALVGSRSTATPNNAWQRL